MKRVHRCRGADRRLRLARSRAGHLSGRDRKTKSDWQAISLQPASKPGAISQGTGGHRHIQAAVDSMRFHLATAVTLCNEG